MGCAANNPWSQGTEFKYAVVVSGEYEGHVARTNDGCNWDEFCIGSDVWKPIASAGSDASANESAAGHENGVVGPWGALCKVVPADAAQQAVETRRKKLLELLDLADRIASKAHAGQVDRGGQPYINHPRHVSACCVNLDAKVAGMLHDVVEDTPITLDDLRGYGFTPDILAAIALLTHKDGVPYLDYVAAAGKNRIAREVKICDLHHNLDASRLGHEPTPKDLERMEKYRRALQILGEKD